MTATVLHAPTSTGHGGTWGLLRSEWTKLWSVRATWWSLVAALLLQGLQGGAIGASFANGAIGDGAERLTVAFAATGGIQLSQMALIALAMLAMTTEYSTGSIAPSLQVVPQRWRLVLGKVSVVGVVGLVAGSVLAVAGAGAGWFGAGVMAHGGIGWLATDPWSGIDLAGLGRAVWLTAVYVGLVSVLAVGIATALRSAVGTLVTVFSLLVLVPGILAGSSLAWLVTIADYLPGGAASAILGDGPYGTGRGIVVLTAWAVAAVVVGLANLQRRDA